MGLPEKFSGSRGAKAERWVNQIGLYMTANAHLFPDNRTKVLWSLSYLDGQALEWADQFAKKLFQAEFVSYDADFAKAFISMYFDTEKKTRAEASLQKLKQTKSVADYTHQFNVHAHHTGWGGHHPDQPLSTRPQVERTTGAYYLESGFYDFSRH
ncbi:hypothetical protein Pst134EA_032226 [Puccinia striiformis f. sp. tritici]|uniref:uncharacterized protein n=1 Tax=Puccinia striiformis f. sp. tritici TaxID=168172 RepID=UPI0020073B60|nr:uncharacterized protein Pst134EA_032226 [Puccinia striiformis f. sp. tritici]KAH9444351.1 hypothetical protein Pst134EA_032226 [Puccinia striiformis f. sp. tritici]